MKGCFLVLSGMTALFATGLYLGMQYRGQALASFIADVVLCLFFLGLGLGVKSKRKHRHLPDER